MIRHVVMFRFLDEAEGRSKAENLLEAKKRLEALRGVVPTLLTNEVRIAAKDSSKDDFDLLLTADFEDFDGLNAYIIHPAHKAVGVFMRSVRESRCCIDVEMQG